MKYQGSKTRLAPHIARIVTQAPGDLYVEPFLGGAATFAKIAPHYPRAIAGEIVEDVALMWQAVARGWEPPTTVTPEEYAALRHAEPSALRGFVGTACSFGGKWFGGYAREGKRNPDYNFAAAGAASVAKRAPALRPPRNFAAEGARSLARRRDALGGVDVWHADYREFGDLMRPGVVVYADPPYRGTLAYKGAGEFDSEAFWQTMDDWHTLGATVFVSEYTAPEHWREVWCKERHTSTALNNSGARATDRLFTR